MVAIVEGKHNAEFILSEANWFRSRENIVIAAAAPALVSGQLLGKITASGKYTAYSDAASDGSQTAVGILFLHAPDKTVDQQAVLIARDAEVIEANLTGLDANGRADLLALGIIVRT
jgi:hypothetical protein